MLRYTAAALSYFKQNFDWCTKILRSQDIYFIGYIALGIEVRNCMHVTQLSYRMNSWFFLNGKWFEMSREHPSSSKTQSIHQAYFFIQYTSRVDFRGTTYNHLMIKLTSNLPSRAGLVASARIGLRLWSKETVTSSKPSFSTNHLPIYPDDNYHSFPIASPISNSRQKFPWNSARHNRNGRKRRQRPRIFPFAPQDERSASIFPPTLSTKQPINPTTPITHAYSPEKHHITKSNEMKNRNWGGTLIPPPSAAQPQTPLQPRCGSPELSS